MEASLEIGVKYYTTEIQNMEKMGKGSKLYDQKGNLSKEPYLSPEIVSVIKEIDKRLGIVSLSEMADVLKDHTRVDGTSRFPAEKSTGMIAYNKLNELDDINNPHPFANRHDALIAEAAIFHECQLITEDKNLLKTVNELFSDRAWTTTKLVDYLQGILLSDRIQS